MAAKRLGVEVDKILIYPLGGISKFKMPLNISIQREFLILIMGPLFQILAYLCLLVIFPQEEIMVKIYHYSILIFNLLPIYPLDGGKLVNLILSLKFSFKESYQITIIISYIMVLLLIGINFPNIQWNLIIIVVFLFYKITKEYQLMNFLYNKFLLERYLKQYHFKKSIIINKSSKFHRNRSHLLKIGDKYYLEQEYLRKIYHKSTKRY